MTGTVASSTSISNPTSLFPSFTSDSSHETLTTAPASSSPPSLTTSPEPSTPSSGFVLSTFTSSFVSEINGSPTTALLRPYSIHRFWRATHVLPLPDRHPYRQIVMLHVTCYELLHPPAARHGQPS